MIGRPRLVLTLAFVLALVGIACAPGAPPAPAGPIELVVAVSGEPGTLDVHQRFSPLEGIVAGLMFDPLILEDPNGAPQPGLAESWQFAADGMSVTLKLRKGVKFHDGTPLNAEAVKFNYERQLDENNEFFKLHKWRLPATFAFNIGRVEVVDESTVKVNLKELLAPDLNLSYMTTSPHDMVSPTAVKAAREKFGDKPIGTGPYKFVSWEKGQRLVFEKNPEYWGKAPQYDKIILIPITDPDARLAALRAGTADLNADVSGDQLEAIRTDQKFGVFEREGRHIWHVLLNQKNVPQLADKRVRQALNYAVNKDAIVKNIIRNQGVVAKCFTSRAYGEWQHTQLAGYAYDPAKAKELLAQAGFPDGRGFPQLEMKLPTDATLAGKPVAMAEAIQADLAAVGIKITLAPSDFGAWVSKVAPGDFQIAVFSLSISLTDPDNALGGYHTSRQPPKFHNFGFYKNDEYERLFPQSRTVKDRSERLKLVKRMQEIACQEDPAAIWVEHAKLAMVANKSKVKAIQLFNEPTLRFNYIERP